MEVLGRCREVRAPASRTGLGSRASSDWLRLQAQQREYTSLHVASGDKVKIQNDCLGRHSATAKNSAFPGPRVIQTNGRLLGDMHPDGLI